PHLPAAERIPTPWRFTLLVKSCRSGARAARNGGAAPRDAGSWRTLAYDPIASQAVRARDSLYAQDRFAQVNCLQNERPLPPDPALARATVVAWRPGGRVPPIPLFARLSGA